MNSAAHWIRYFPLIFLLAGGLSAQSITIEELQTSGRLQVRSFLVPADNIVPGQQVMLTVEIATDRWFTGGTRIEIPEVPGLIILQTDNFASNSSERREGESWVVQRWSLEVYPQRSGNFRIPPISAQVKISDPESGSVEGRLISPERQLSVILPPSLAQTVHWVAAPTYEVRQEFDRPLEGLQPGDAITRKIVFKASEVMAMMLPAFESRQIAGLTAYPDPPVLHNNSNRGVTMATRSQQITYIAEDRGRYQLPAQEYFWWDTRRGEVQLLSLPAVEIVVGSQGAIDEAEDGGFDSRFLWIMAAGLALLVAAAWLVRSLSRRFELALIRSRFRNLQQLWHRLRQPALPTHLNPGSSAEH